MERDIIDRLKKTVFDHIPKNESPFIRRIHESAARNQQIRRNTARHGGLQNEVGTVDGRRLRLTVRFVAKLVDIEHIPAPRKQPCKRMSGTDDRLGHRGSALTGTVRVQKEFRVAVAVPESGKRTLSDEIVSSLFAGAPFAGLALLEFPGMPFAERFHPRAFHDAEEFRKIDIREFRMQTLHDVCAPEVILLFFEIRKRDETELLFRGGNRKHEISLRETVIPRELSVRSGFQSQSAAFCAAIVENLAEKLLRPVRIFGGERERNLFPGLDEVLGHVDRRKSQRLKRGGKESAPRNQRGFPPLG